MKIDKSPPYLQTAKNFKIAILLPRFNDLLGNRLYQNTYQGLIKKGAFKNHIQLFRVPGSLELPFIAKRIARQKKFHVIIALGVIIQGETTHFEHVCRETYSGLMNVMLETETPIIFGVLTVKNRKQAEDRIAKSGMDKGAEFAESALEMAQLSHQFMSS